MLHTHLIVRDDALALYGFATEEERDLFLHAPRRAVGGAQGGAGRPLGRARRVSCSAVVAAGDVARLQAAPGVGKRTAERIIVELREKVGATLPEDSITVTRADDPRDAGPRGPARPGLQRQRDRCPARGRLRRQHRGPHRPRAAERPAVSGVGGAVSRTPRSCPGTSWSSTARCGPAGWRTSSARRRSATSWPSRSRPPPSAARRWTTCCWPARRASGKTSLAQIVAAELDVPFVQTAGPALERKGDVASFLTALEPRAVFFVDEIHRLPRALEETFYPAMEDGDPADHGRPGRRRAHRHPAAAAVHADRRHHPRRPAHHPAARPLRDPAPPRALRARGSGRAS